MDCGLMSDRQWLKISPKLAFNFGPLTWLRRGMEPEVYRFVKEIRSPVSKQYYI